MKRSKMSKMSLATNYDSIVGNGTIKGHMKMKNLQTQSSWHKVWTLLSESDLLVYHHRSDVMPRLTVDLIGCRVTPADWLTQQKHPFRCFGNGFDLLFATESKSDQVKWMNAAGLVSIGYTPKLNGGKSGDKLKLDETVNIERDKQLIARTSPIRTRILQRNVKSDELIQLIDDLDIGSGLTRKQTMKRRLEQLSRDPVHNELLHRQVKYERQLKALQEDLDKINELIEGEISDETIIDFQRMELIFIFFLLLRACRSVSNND